MEHASELVKPLFCPRGLAGLIGSYEILLDTSDLDAYDLTAGALPRNEWFQRYERFVKDASIHLRLPAGLLDAVRAQAAKEKVPTQRLIREYIERGLRMRGHGGPKREVRAKAR
jgi:predicted DNA binding CopG/RHH family protein